MSADNPHQASMSHQVFIGEEDQGERLDKRLAQELDDIGLSRERIQTLIRDGQVRLNGQPVTKPAQRLKEGDHIRLWIPEARPIDLAPEAIPLDVVYEDAHLLVVNKPAGMLTHPTGRTRTGTLVNALLAHCGESLSGINGHIRPGIVHRLDRDTSGLLMVAKNDAAHLHLSEQIKTKRARRHYQAIVQGRFTDDAGTVNAPIGRNPKQRDKMAIVPDGRAAITHWQVRQRLGHQFARLDLQLETGRTHQIRVHMSHIGHPLVGDPLYGSGLEKTIKLKTQGQLLQACRLGFVHPQSQTPLLFEIPSDPALEAAWAWLLQHYA